MPKPIPERSTASAVHGLWFVFDQDNHIFAIWTSAISGKEEVYVDGNLVAVRRKIALTSAHTFKVGEHEYTIALSTPNVRKGVFHTTLARSGTVLQGWQTRYVTRRSAVTAIATIFTFAALTFMFLGQDLLPWYFVYAVAGVAVGSFVWSTSGSGYGYVVEPLIVAPNDT